jgi:hypothetical protein
VADLAAGMGVDGILMTYIPGITAVGLDLQVLSAVDD